MNHFNWSISLVGDSYKQQQIYNMCANYANKKILIEVYKNL